ncbi:MAG: hypothetical protein IJN37_08855 [Clostridia bacterium]|nr:hypothetical protein [Clostridia bacterium]
MKRIKDPEKRIVLTAILSLMVNILYAVGNLYLGFYQRSYWFITAGAYYVVLATMRFTAVMAAGKSRAEQNYILKFSGIMLLFMSWVLSGSVYLSIRYDVAKIMHEIVMITIATYAFTKITLAIINLIKVRRFNSPALSTLRSISLADGVVSIYSLQRSMLVSFKGMTAENIKLMNILTGTGVWLIVLTISVIMIMKSKRSKNG